MTARVATHPAIKIGDLRLTELEARVVLEALELLSETEHGRLDGIVRTLVCDLYRGMDAQVAATLERLMAQASDALHPGRSSFAEDEVPDLGILVEGLRRLAADDHEGYLRYRKLLQHRHKVRLAKTREARRRGATKEKQP